RIIAKAADQPVKTVLAANVAGLDPNQRVGREFLADTQQWFVDNKLVNEPVKVDKLFDDSFAKRAVKKLGTY
ncbi:MAG: hypothetical protein ACRDT8_16815, partial [Micromonosporaceae bacterium]